MGGLDQCDMTSLQQSIRRGAQARDESERLQKRRVGPLAFEHRLDRARRGPGEKPLHGQSQDPSCMAGERKPVGKVVGACLVGRGSFHDQAILTQVYPHYPTGGYKFPHR